MSIARIQILNPGYVFEAQKLFGAMTVKPPGQVAHKLSDAIARLQRAQLWNKIDVGYFLAVHDGQAARLNIKAPGSFTCAAVSSPTFTALRGYAGNGSSSYLDTGWVPGTNGVNFTQNSAHLAGWSATQLAGQTGQLMGCELAAGASQTNIYPRFTDNNAYCRIAETSASGGFANTKTTGLFSGGRSSSTARDFFLDGVSLGTYGSTAGAALPTDSMFLLAANSNPTPTAFSTYTLSFMCAGAYLDINEQGRLFRAIKPYMDFAGVPS